MTPSNTPDRPLDGITPRLSMLASVSTPGAFLRATLAPMRKDRIIQGLVAAGVAGWAACGCAARINLAGEGVLLGELNPLAAPTLHLEEALPALSEAEESLVRFVVIAGKGQGDVVLEHWERDEASDAWRVTVSDESTGKVFARKRVERRPDGALVQTQLIKPDRGLIVETSPPPIIMPLQLRAGEPVVSEMSMRLPFISNPERVRAQGTARKQLELLGTQRIVYGGAEHVATVVREDFRTNLGPATSHRVSERWYVPGIGLVLERWDERVKVLGVPIEHTTQALRRMMPGEHLPAQPPGAKSDETASTIRSDDDV